MSDRLLSQEFVEAVDGHSVTSVRPYFSTKGTIYRVKIGSSVTMACEIINLGKYIYANPQKWTYAYIINRLFIT